MDSQHTEGTFLARKCCAAGHPGFGGNLGLSTPQGPTSLSVDLELVLK